MPIRIYSLANRQPVLSISLRVVELNCNRTAYEGWRNSLWDGGHNAETRKIVCLFREPDAGNLPVRFDEREQETGSSQTGLRRALRKHPNSTGRLTATAPVLDSTPHYTH
jgi:hypothetical protein